MNCDRTFECLDLQRQTDGDKAFLSCQIKHIQLLNKTRRDRPGPAKLAACGDRGGPFAPKMELAHWSGESIPLSRAGTEGSLFVPEREFVYSSDESTPLGRRSAEGGPFAPEREFPHSSTQSTPLGGCGAEGAPFAFPFTLHESVAA